MRSGTRKSSDSFPQIETVNCAMCAGSSRFGNGQCPSCDGKGLLTVAAPSATCPHCNGTGKPIKKDLRSDMSAELSQVCPICLGTGWSLVLW